MSVLKTAVRLDATFLVGGDEGDGFSEEGSAIV